jgi:hypothetical protein
VRPLLFLVLELAVVHDTTNRRAGHRSDLDQIDPGVLCYLQRGPDTHDSELFPFHPLETNLRRRNFFVQAMCLILSYGVTPENNNN